eukprot:scaffold3673_cov393-Prasinococcus_capsulatus_cf.AAC.14
MRAYASSRSISPPWRRHAALAAGLRSSGARHIEAASTPATQQIHAPSPHRAARCFGALDRCSATVA